LLLKPVQFLSVLGFGGRCRFAYRTGTECASSSSHFVSSGE
jgi:hypothetical protein